MPNLNTNRDWKLVTATVVSSTANWGGGPRYFGDSIGHAELPRYNTTFEYKVGECDYRGEYSTGTQQEEGLQFKILCDPADPRRNTLSEKARSWWSRCLVWVFAAAHTWFAIRYLPVDLLQ